MPKKPDSWESFTSAVGSVSPEIPAVKKYFTDELDAQGDNDLKKVVAAGTVLETLNNPSAVGSVSPEIPAVKKYFTDELDAQGDNDLKKVVAAGTVLETLNNPEESEMQRIEVIVHVVDSGVTAAKIAYKVAEGEMETVDAVDVLTDHGTAQITTLSKKLAAGIGIAIGKAIGSVFGPVGTVTGAVIGKTVGKLAGKVVSKVIVPGVKKVASVAKKVVHTAWEGVKSVGHAVASGARKVVSKLTGGRCFITTATCQSLGKPDDCAELRTFRWFRDTYLAYEPDGKTLITEYYEVAPAIVTAINNAPNKDELYADIWQNHLSDCLALIASGNYPACKDRYTLMVNLLKRTFCKER